MNIEALASERLRRLSKEGFWIVLGQAAAVLGALAGVRILTELLHPPAYGELALGMTLATLLSQTLLGPLGHGAARFYAPAAELNDTDRYVRAVCRLLIWATGIVALIFLIATGALATVGRTHWIPIVAAAFVFALTSGCNSVFNGIHNSARHRAIVALHQGTEAWLRFVVAAGLILWLGATSVVALTGYAIAAVLVIGSHSLYLRRILQASSLPPASESHWHAAIWNYSWPFGVWGIFYWAQSASDRWALELFAGTEEVGVYAVLFQLGYYPMSMFATIGMQFFAPILYQRAGDGSDARRSAHARALSWQLTGVVLCITGVVVLAAVLFHEQIFDILVAKDYRSVSHLLPWMLMAGGIFTAGQSVALNLMSQLRTHAMIGATVVPCLLGSSLNFLGAHWYGIRGVVVAGVLFSIAYLVWMTGVSMRSGRPSDG